MLVLLARVGDNSASDGCAERGQAKLRQKAKPALRDCVRATTNSNCSPCQRLNRVLFDVHEFTRSSQFVLQLNDLKGQQPFTAGDERLLLATNSAELLYLQAERIGVRRNVTLDLEWFEPATPGLIGPKFEVRHKWHSIAVRRFPIFCSLHQLFEGSAAFEQRTFKRGLERLFDAAIVERHPVLTHRRH